MRTALNQMGSVKGSPGEERTKSTGKTFGLKYPELGQNPLYKLIT